MIKLSTFLNGEIHPLLHGAFLSRIIQSNDGKYFAAVSSYQKSTKVKDPEFDFYQYTEKYVETLNDIIGFSGWISKEEYDHSYNYCNFINRGKEKAFFIIENDLNISNESFFSKLYKKLFTDVDYIQGETLNENKKNFIRGFCELRGSIDTSRPLIAMDYFYDNGFELNKARLLNEYMGVPYYIININFRQLQTEYLLGINKRNTQLRLQLNWYSNNIGFINEYKVKIIQNSYIPLGYKKINQVHYVEFPVVEYRESDLFVTRLNHFSSKLFNKDLSSKNIDDIRKELGFDIEKDASRSIKVQRNREIVELVRLYTEDECAGCKTKFDISERSFTHRKTGRPYFEIHHTISFNNNIELDHEDNLVKLCPVCHSCIKSGVGTPEAQQNIIRNILHNALNVKQFVHSFFDTSDEKILIDEIYYSLR